MFLPVKGYEDYLEVNEAGVFRDKKTGNIRKPKSCNSTGYLELRWYVDKKRIYKTAHRLVALTHIPNPENKKVVNHIDGNKHNNHVSNLQWVSHSENCLHAIKEGLAPKIKYDRVSPSIVNEIRSSYIPKCRANGYAGLARKYNISTTAVFKIVNNLSYRGD